MTVTVHLYDQLRDRLGQRSLRVELPEGADVGELFRALCRDHDPIFGQLSEDESTPYALNVLVLNGRTLRLPRDNPVPLQDGDELHFIPPIAGG